MNIKIKNIVFQYENDREEPIGADVSYDLRLNESKLNGNIEISNKELFITQVPLWEFNRYIHRKIMESM